MAGDWQEEFRRKTVSAEEAVRVIKSGDRVSFTHGREPPTVTCAMVARKNELKNVKVFMRTPSLDFPWYHEDWNDSFPLEISYVRPIARNIMAERRVDFVPGSPFCVVAENVHKLVPGSKLNIIKNGPIDIDRVWPKEFAEAVLNFLKSEDAKSK